MQNKAFLSSVKKTKKELTTVVAKAVSENCDNIGELIAKTFVTRAKQRLLRDNNGTNQTLIKRASQGIFARRYNGKWRVVVSRQFDEEGILIFLEYGTGLVGKANKHPEAGKVGWDYAINEDDYKRRSNGKTGWFFRPQGLDRYIDKDDIAEIYKRSFKAEGNKPFSIEYYDRYGNGGGGLWKTNRIAGSTAKVVFSSGIKPVRYLYNTKLEIVRLINSCNGDQEKLVQKLNELRSASI